ncbi:MAG: hypothetical protein IJM30_13430 [Thermoguttaceae bacterium]|nr:hypothetical protein [Thermoguttaceae bacterium]
MTLQELDEIEIEARKAVYQDLAKQEEEPRIFKLIRYRAYLLFLAAMWAIHIFVCKCNLQLDTETTLLDPEIWKRTAWIVAIFEVVRFALIFCINYMIIFEMRKRIEDGKRPDNDGGEDNG